MGPEIIEKEELNMDFIIATLITVVLAFVIVGFLLIPYFYGCYALWLKLSLSWKIILPIIYVLLMYLAIKYEIFQFVFRLLG